MTRKHNGNGSGSQPENDSGFSPQQVLEMGQAAASLLQNPVYNLAHRIAVDEIINAWSTSKPQEVKTREALWAELQAHGRAAQHLGSLVGRAQELLQNQANQQEQEQAEYIDQQGFGSMPFGGPEGEVNFQ